MASVGALRENRFDPLIGLNKAYAILRRDALQAVSYNLSFALQWLQQVVNVAVVSFVSHLVPSSSKFGYGGHPGSYFNYLAVNLAFVNFQTTAIQTFASVIRQGQMQGTLEVLLSTPTSISLIVLSGGLWAFALTFMETAVFLGVAMLFGLDLHRINLMTGALFLVLTILSLSCLGVISAAVAIIFKQSLPFDFVITGLTYVFGGVYVPLSSMPHFLQYIGWMLPITHALNGMRAAVQGVPLTSLFPDVMWLVVAIIVLFPTSLFTFDRAVRLAKIDGTLAHY